MMKRYDHEMMGRSNRGWLKSLFHFSFAEYHNPDRMGFGPLRVVNDDLVAAGGGFDLHPHRDMEILSYVVEGQLAHADSMGHRRTIGRGGVQYMSAGTGVRHSEHNAGDQTLRFLQIWIQPDRKGHTPDYGDRRFEREQRLNRWLLLASGSEGEAPFRLHQDASIRVIELEKAREIGFDLAEDRQAYLVQIEGTATINGVQLQTRDALEVVGEPLAIRADEPSHLLLIEMARD